MKSVFLVDDSTTMRMPLKSTLEISGFKVEPASGRPQALTKIMGGLKPDQLLSHMQAPWMELAESECPKIVLF
jgi:two-component system, chemotaxis family, chemotaxis protein CheY